MKEMTETREWEIKGQMCDPHEQATCNHAEGGNHATCSQARYKICHSCPHTSYDNQMNSDTDIMLKDDQDNIQASELTCRVE